MQNPFLQTAVECTPHARWTVQRAFMLNLTRFGSRRRMIYFRPRIGWWWRWYKLMESLFSFEQKKKPGLFVLPATQWGSDLACSKAANQPHSVSAWFGLHNFRLVGPQ